MTDRSSPSRCSILPWLKRRSTSGLAILAAAAITATGAFQSRCEVVSCKPILTITSSRFSEVRDFQRVWTATVLAEASYCATTSGPFEIDFIRSKEYGPDVQFTKPFRWTRGRFEISVDFWADEAVLDYRIGFIAPCVCRE